MECLRVAHGLQMGSKSYIWFSVEYCMKGHDASQQLGCITT